MAKKRTGRRKGVNKSQKIRDYLDKSPGAMPKTIIADLAAKGIHVSAALVSAVKYGGKKTAKTSKKGRRKAAAGRNSVTVDELLKAKQLTDQLGGVDRVKAALDTLAKLK